MGICSNKPQKQCSKELLEKFSQTKQLQEKFMKEVYDQQHESKNYNNIKTTQVSNSITQSVDLVNNSTHQRRKGVSVNRMAMSNMKYGINHIAEKSSNNHFYKQKYHKVIGLLLSNINLGKMDILENNETHQLVMCETLTKNEENHQFFQWLKQKNIDHDNIIGIQEIQSLDSDYQIIYEYWQDQCIVAQSDYNASIILYQMFEAIEYLHENDLRYSCLTFDSFRQCNKNIIKLTQLRNIYELPTTTQEILKYSPPDTYRYPPDRKKSRDIWALGIIGLQLFSGQFPFLKKEQMNQRRTILGIINNLTQEKIELYISQFHKDLQQLFSGMLQIDEQERFTINQCKTNQFIQNNLSLYISDLITPILNFYKYKFIQTSKAQARFHLIRILDNKQFVALHNLFSQIDTQKNRKIKAIQIRDYYDQIYQPATVKSEISEIKYSLPKNFEICYTQFIGASCNLTEELLSKYYQQNFHTNLSIIENIQLLKLPSKQCRIIEKDFSSSEIVQKLSFDLFLRYII